MLINAGFNGKRVVVTGASRGLGQALSICLADQGAELVLLARSIDGAQKTAEIIAERTGRIPAAFAANLADPDSVAAACESVLTQDNRVDVLVNNGALWLAGGIDAATAAQIIETVNSAVTGSILMVKHLLPGLCRSLAADIINVVSTAGLPNAPRQASAAFHAAKHGQSGFSDLLRQELKERSIRVTAIYPPDFDDLSPLDLGWEQPRSKEKGDRLSNREVVDTILFALAQPRICSISAIVLDNA
ncbi:SDR family oxidoreductase [Rhodospirillaceae bacterium SYSU D60014]|uniref:SDR family oxidoreductase n=1 Tax=Virgifigura deserti TaxID=2268457 RepID=UPI000E6617C5